MPIHALRHHFYAPRHHFWQHSKLREDAYFLSCSSFASSEGAFFETNSVRSIKKKQKYLSHEKFFIVNEVGEISQMCNLSRLNHSSGGYHFTRHFSYQLWLHPLSLGILESSGSCKLVSLWSPPLPLLQKLLVAQLLHN